MTVELILGDCLEKMREIPDKSVDLVLTDPPYEEKYNFIWALLAMQSARVLKVGGSLISLLGHYQLPFVINAFEQHLRFWWILWMEHGNLNRLPGKWVCVKGKPALWYVKDRRKPKDTECPLDTLSAGNNNDWKESQVLHKWGQPTAWFEHYISRLTDEGDTVLDPFMGSGTTGVACVKLGRNFIGIEISEQYFKIAQRRIAEAQAQTVLPLTT